MYVRKGLIHVHVYTCITAMDSLQLLVYMYFAHTCTMLCTMFIWVLLSVTLHNVVM